MQTSIVEELGSEQNLANSTTKNIRHKRSFVSNPTASTSKVFGDNLTLQRNTFSIVAAAIIVLVPLLAWARFQLGEYHPHTTTVAVAMMVACLPALFSSFYPKLERFAGHLLVTVMTASLVAFVALNGGLSAPVLVLAPLLPLCAGFLIGHRAGLISAAAVLLSILILALQPPTSLPAVTAVFKTPLAYGLFIAATSFVVALTSWGYERRFRKLQAELYYSATHDALTGLANRKSLENALFREAERRRTPYPVSMIVLDIDHFKRFNDSHGHQAGDEVLRTVASIALASAKRPSDVVARYGGDEFVIVLPNTSHEDAIAIGERLRSNMERHRFKLNPLDEAKPQKASDDVATLSIGVATHPAGRYADPRDFADDLMARADSAMYRSKQAGRNRVVASPNRLSAIAGQQATQAA